MKPWDFDILLLHAKTSRETITIGINLLKKYLRKVQHYLSFLNNEKILAVSAPLTLLPKTTISFEHGEG
jgi:hypothetical protein